MRRIDIAYEKFVDEFAEPFDITEEQRKDEMFKLGVQKAIMSFACPNSFEVGPQMGRPNAPHIVSIVGRKTCKVNEYF